jgi:hypothetical protein
MSTTDENLLSRPPYRGQAVSGRRIGVAAAAEPKDVLVEVGLRMLAAASSVGCWASPRNVETSPGQSSASSCWRRVSRPRNRPNRSPRCGCPGSRPPPSRGRARSDAEPGKALHCAPLPHCFHGIAAATAEGRVGRRADLTLIGPRRSAAPVAGAAPVAAGGSTRQPSPTASGWGCPGRSQTAAAYSGSPRECSASTWKKKFSAESPSVESTYP